MMVAMVDDSNGIEYIPSETIAQIISSSKNNPVFVSVPVSDHIDTMIKRLYNKSEKLALFWYLRKSLFL